MFGGARFPESRRQGNKALTPPTPFPIAIEPSIAAPVEVLVCEFGARLDASNKAPASEQILKAQRLYNAIIACIRTVHAEMNAWVLQRAGPRAKALQDMLSACELEIAAPTTTANAELLHVLAPRRMAIATELTSLLRPARAEHRSEIRTLFFARVGKTTATDTYR